MDHRPGKANKKTIQDWRRLLEEAYRQSFYDVLDAIDDGVLTLAHAYTLTVQGGGGLAAIRAYLQKLGEERERKTKEGSFPDWLEDFLDLKPRVDASDNQYQRIEMAVRAFMAFLVERHDLADASDITRSLWTKENLRAYVTHYVETKHAAARERLEARWRSDGMALTPTEKSDLLRRDRGAKQVTANRHVNLVGAFSKWLLEHGRIDHDPARGNRLSIHRETRHRADDHRALSTSELAGFLRWSAAYDKDNPCEPGERPDTLWWTWLVSSGATTYTEGVRLRPMDIHADTVEEGTVEVTILGTKAARRKRSVYISEGLAKRLLERAHRMGVGRTRQIFPFSESQGRTAWNNVLEMINEEDPELFAGLKGATPYCLRHTYAVNCIQAGVHINNLQELMGHSDIRTTVVYLKQATRARVGLAQMFRIHGLT